jgi:uncharacterized protein
VRLFKRRPILDDEMFALLDAAAANGVKSTALLQELIGDFPEKADLVRELTLCEQDGDRITHQMITRLNERHFRDYANSSTLHELARRLDDIVDYAEEVGDQLVLYGIEAPMEQAEQMSEVLVQSADAVQCAIGALRDGGPMLAELRRIHELENEGDRLSREATASLFKNGIDPLVIIRWKDVFASLEQAIDSCEGVAHLLDSVRLNGRR